MTCFQMITSIDEFLMDVDEKDIRSDLHLRAPLVLSVRLSRLRKTSDRIEDAIRYNSFPLAPLIVVTHFFTSDPPD